MPARVHPPMNNRPYVRGEVMHGWTAKRWAEHLRYIASATEPHWPERAAELRAEADEVERRE